MTLPGKAFLALWHDITPEGQEDYMEWHTREHLPERLSIPGFLVGKRLVNPDVERYRYGTIYAGSDVEVFRSQAYLDRLNNPTEWSNRTQPTFRNFLRVACDRLASAGTGEGGAMATIRLSFANGEDGTALRAGAQALADRLQQAIGVGCAHVGIARTEVSGIRTRETDIRPGMAEPEFDALVLAEGSEVPALERALPELERVIAESGCGLTSPQSIVYWLGYQLDHAQATGEA